MELKNRRRASGRNLTVNESLYGVCLGFSGSYKYNFFALIIEPTPMVSA